MSPIDFMGGGKIKGVLNNELQFLVKQTVIEAKSQQ